VIVEGLRTPPGGLFLVQEPEIHLHADAQLRMADFLVSLVRTQRRVIAETRSEHILLRVRKSIVNGSSGTSRGPRLSPQDVSVIYVEKKSDGTSVTEPLRIDDLGQIANWPSGFMTGATEEHMSILDEMARRAEVLK
jgi:predicted ATPase